ncbi:D-alanyl-D-alanine carboxypeptidase [uncultured Caudovirales phage]|uniref:D-alanyl-D-alanine carboxypeptidase n=1 Tax=uncultured Caudovirales phage TaxID=2100421 RepID=A0A6J7XEA5_9CAUD|nr:D-alanyl-D-alanine carboxypeptidase [uncultured Caudovirales phage]CAB4183091.1 D-alanyl-D-alanine carboxypeptidase [uncultured Caudovirales phage]CAB5228185.1 D-alanyl-D-alanine carboxypeptidase [uncultured Caudovirales phage]
MKLSPSSEAKLKGVHPSLIKVVRRAAADWTDPHLTWIITCGPRTVAAQKLLVAAGASKTMNSRHIPGKDGYSKAVDLAAVLRGKLKWDWPLYAKLAAALKAAASKEMVPIEWGGDWRTFKDGPHFQLPKNLFP